MPRGDRCCSSLVASLADFELSNKEKSNCYYMIPKHLQLLQKILSSCCLNCLVDPSTAAPFALSAFLVLFTTLSLVSCSVICTLTLPPFLIMERVSPTAHLTVLTFVLVVNLPIIPLLYRRSLRLHSTFELFRQPQTWIMISNFTFVFSPVILLALIVSKTIPLNNGNFEFCVRHSN